MSASAAGAPVAPAAAARLPRQVKLFGAVSLLNDFASEMIYPLLPALVTGVLGAGPQALGALEGAADSAARRADRGRDTRTPSGSCVRPATRTRSRRGRARPAPGVVAPRLGNRERAAGDRLESGAGSSGLGAGGMGGKGR